MAVGGKVWTDTTVGTVGSSTAGDGALNDDVVDDALIHIELLALSVCLQVNEEFTDGLDRLLWPSSLSVLEFLDLSVSSNATSELSEWNNLFVFKNILHVFDSLLQVPALNSAGDFVSVLEVGSEVGNLALSS